MVCRDANSRREPFCFLIDAPKQSQTHFLCKSLFFASCLDLIEVGAFMRFNDPLRTHVFGSAPNKRKPCIFFVVSCFCHFFLNTLLGTITNPYEGELKWMIVSFFRLVGYVCLFPGG